MSLEQAKNALVASFFELSNAAKDAATATVNFYKAAGINSPETAASLAALSESITGATHAALAQLPTEIKANGNAEKPVSRKRKRKDDASSVSEAAEADGKVEAGKSAPAQPEKAIAPVLLSQSSLAPSQGLPVTSAPAATEPEKTEKAEKAEKPEKPKKRKIERDPNAPKKPLTTYLRFNLSIRDKMKRERIENGLPTYPATELNQIIAERWANLSTEERESLQKAYESEFEDYKRALESYNAVKTAEGGVPIPIPGAPRKSSVKAAAKKKEEEKNDETKAAPAAEKKEVAATQEKAPATAEKTKAPATPKVPATPKEKPAAAAAPKAAANSAPKEKAAVTATPKEKKKKAKPAALTDNSSVANAIAAAVADLDEEAAKLEQNSSQANSHPSTSQGSTQHKKKKKDKDATGEEKKKKKKKSVEGSQSH